ncbi:hypothetical protein [Desulfobacter sp.]|uniref:ParM/StbA family protein n=1 Tax=Desulfobacter sp. TaxID=2294 RepID=UPI0025807AD3|nr:hypothetical protein [Desulfobacter sp.]
MEIIGIDVGFGFTKAYSGQNSVIFKSLIGDAPDIQFMSSMGDAAAAANLHITLDNKTYFLGAYAERQSSLTEYTLDQEKWLKNSSRYWPLRRQATKKYVTETLQHPSSGWWILDLKQRIFPSLTISSTLKGGRQPWTQAWPSAFP